MTRTATVFARLLPPMNLTTPPNAGLCCRSFRQKRLRSTESTPKSCADNLFANSLKRDLLTLQSNTHVRSRPESLPQFLASNLRWQTNSRHGCRAHLNSDCKMTKFGSTTPRSSENSSWNRSSTGKRTQVTISSHSCSMLNLMASPFRCQSFEAMSVSCSSPESTRRGVQSAQPCCTSQRTPKIASDLSTSPTSFQLQLKNFSARIHR